MQRSKNKLNHHKVSFDVQKKKKTKRNVLLFIHAPGTHHRMWDTSILWYCLILYARLLLLAINGWSIYLAMAIWSLNSHTQRAYMIYVNYVIRIRNIGRQKPSILYNNRFEMAISWLFVLTPKLNALRHTVIYPPLKNMCFDSHVLRS